MQKMLEQIKLIVQHNCQLELTKPLVLGVSGGPDSLCLLDVLHQLGFLLVIVHLNHGLRPEAEGDAARVERIASQMGLPFVSRKEDVASYAAANALSLEEAARTIRYRFLFEQARILGAQAVAVAHTADDQVETVLMHFLRGAGLPGLKGMPMRLLPNPWSQAIPLVRPFLMTWREAVLAYCRERGLEPVEDRTNLDPRFTRNRLRHALLPALESYNPGVRQALLRTAQVLAGDDEILEGAIDSAWHICVLDQGEGCIAFDAPVLADQLTGIQRRLVRRAIAILRPGLRDVDFEAIERALAFLSSPSRTSRLDLIAGLALKREGNRLWLHAWEAGLPEAGWPQVPGGPLPLELDVPGEIELPHGWRIQAEPAQDLEQARWSALSNGDPYQAWLDAAGLRLPLQVKSRRPGDRFQPLGMGGHSLKLSDYLVNVKLPSRARERWPLVCSGPEIIWVPGYRLAHPFRVTPETQTIFYLHLTRS